MEDTDKTVRSFWTNFQGWKDLVGWRNGYRKEGSPDKNGDLRILKGLAEESLGRAGVYVE